MYARMPVYLLFFLCWSCNAIPPGRVQVNSTTATTASLIQHRIKHVISSGAALAIIAGLSLGGTTASQLASGLQGQGYTVGVVIKIENYTKWPLTNGQSLTKWGYVKNTIHTVAPGQKEAWQAHKTKGTVVGSAGLIFYNIDGLDENIVIVWHAPYNFNHLLNTLAVGIYSNNHVDGQYAHDLYYTMRNKDISQTPYEGYPTWPGCRGSYYYSTRLCSTYSPYIQVDGTMGTSHHPTISIKVHARYDSNNFEN